MIISLGADHRGYKYKEQIKTLLNQQGIKTEDFGCFSEDSSDYPDFGIKAAEAVSLKMADKGIIICGTGNGMLMAANKVKGIRAGIALSAEMARLARAHNDVNILVLSEMFTPADEIENIVKLFLATEFEGGRHARRIGKIADYEKG
jgi:ribose 5-phosphate isomerase B